jgi:hypothetical protein
MRSDERKASRLRRLFLAIMRRMLGKTQDVSLPWRAALFNASKPQSPSARIIFNKGAATLDCTLRNLSETGAAIEVASTVGVPEEFDLVLLADKSVHRCHVVWRSMGRLGLHFIQ